MNCMMILPLAFWGITKLVSIVAVSFYIIDWVFYSFWSHCKLNCFYNLLLTCSLQVYRNTTDFCVLGLYPADLLNLLILALTVFCEISRFFNMSDHIICIQRELYFILSILFICFSWLIVLVWTSRTVLNQSGETWHCCFVPDLGEKALSLSQLSMMLCVSFPHMAFIVLRNFPTIIHLLFLH